MLKRYSLVLAVLVICLLIPRQSMAEGQMWGDDVLVHEANHIYGFGMDQADRDTLFLVVSDSSTTNLKDTLYIYRSIDNGQTWSLVRFWYSGVDDYRYGKADIIAAKGYIDAVYVFRIVNHVLYCTRHSYDLSEFHFTAIISDPGENVTDFAICNDIYSDYYLHAVYQTDQDSVIFKRSIDFDTTWIDRVNLTDETSGAITSQPSIAWSQGKYLVVAGKTSDDKIYTIRNTFFGDSLSWQDGQYPSGFSSCDYPVVAGSHDDLSSDAIFWVFYERLITTPITQWILNFHWSTDAGSTWSSISSPNDTSSGNRLYPSLHVLKENDVSNITLAYRYEVGADPREVRYIYKDNAQSNPSVWNAPYTGVNDHNPHFDPPQRAYTIRRTDNTIGSAMLYVHRTEKDLYFDATWFTGVEDELGDKIAIKGFSLGQNYPNPFNASTVIGYSLDKDTKVEIAVYNILGQKLKTLFEGYKERGNHKIVWDGTDRDGILVSSGVYFYRIKAGDKVESRKMILMK